jgi:hypothetical protein
MEKQLASPEIQNFIRQHEHDDEKQLVLRHREILGVPVAKIAEQIIGRRKAKVKIPEYYNASGIIFPPGVNLEQSSSGYTAELKSRLLQQVAPAQKTLVDLTGGFGIDSFYFSKAFAQVEYVEPNGVLLDIARHNHTLLGATGITHHHQDAASFLKAMKHSADCIFIDPSRRKEHQRKIFKLAECEPDITALQDLIFEKTTCFMIKTSPLLDIRQGLRELDHVEQIFVVAIDNDCKEILFLANKKYDGEPSITAIHRRQGQEEKFSFMLSEESNAVADFSPVLEYLYEPNAALLKAGAFKILSAHFSISKLHPSTHLYTSRSYLSDFPGRIFKALSFPAHDSKVVQKIFPDGKANVITRNYPVRPEELQKKLKLKDGGDEYLLAFTSKEGRQLCHASRLK